MDSLCEDEQLSHTVEPCKAVTCGGMQCLSQGRLAAVGRQLPWSRLVRERENAFTSVFKWTHSWDMCYRMQASPHEPTFLGSTCQWKL